MTGKNLGRMYANEWVERCLQARHDAVEENAVFGAVDLEGLKKISTEVYGQFNYMLLTARLRTRTEVMQSRKGLAEETTYGKCLLSSVFAKSNDFFRRRRVRALLGASRC